MKIRAVVFWLHLVAGVSAGLVIAIMSATGALLAFESQIVAWVERDESAREARESEHAWPTSEVRDGATSVTLFREATRRPLVQKSGATWRYDPRAQTAEKSGVRGAFHAIETWHRSLGAEGERRDLGKAVTGAANLLFVVLGVSGLVLWWPRRLAWRNFKAVLLFQRGLRGKPRDFNWHHVTGIWMVLVLLVISTSGAVISYRWASNLVYRAAGDAPPPPPSSPPAPQTPIAPPSIALIIKNVESVVPEWDAVTVPLRARVASAPASAPTIDLTVIERGVALPWARQTVTLDRDTGHVVRHERFTEAKGGRRARGLLRFLHTGQALGLAGQALACVGSLAALLLVYTGVALTWRRFFRR